MKVLPLYQQKEQDMAIAIIGSTFVIVLVFGTLCAIVLSSKQTKKK